MMKGSNDHIETIARRKLAPLPDAWEISEWERVDPDATIIKGSVTEQITRGPRKGQLRWINEHGRVVVVTDAEKEAEFERYQTETGNCGKCMGKREVVWGWGKDTGTRYKTCPHCNGTGKAKP